LARVLGESVIPPGEGPGAAYADAIRVVQWVYLAEDTSGCEGAVASIIPAEAQPEGEGMPSFPPGTWLRALGNEPFWNVTVGVEGVRVSRLGFDDIAFPVSGPTVESGTRIWSGESAGHRFELAIREDRCADTMADRTYPFTAVLMLDGTEYQGCALESPEEVM
jgi:putative lipoprotein